MDNPTIEQLLAARIPAKRAEDAAIEHRRGIDKQIVALMRDPAKTEGSVSRKFDDGLKITATFGVDRKVEDVNVLTNEWQNLSETQRKAFVWKPEVRDGELKKLSDDDRKAVSKFIVAKPSTPSIKLEIA